MNTTGMSAAVGLVALVISQITRFVTSTFSPAVISNGISTVSDV